MATPTMKTSLLLLGALVLGTQPVHASVLAADAACLKSALTPFGAERAGNKDGSIPAWNGGMITASAADQAGGRRTDPFKDEKPLYSVSAKTMVQHAERLSDGTKALLQKYPDSYRLDVYPTHRTATAPQWVYDNTLRNATQAKVVVGPAGPMPFWFAQKLEANHAAKRGWEALSPSRQKEILRYFAGLKSLAAQERNTERALLVLAGGKARFMARSWND